MKIKFVITIPAWNCERYIQRAILSALRQRYDRDLFRVLFIDDASVDQTAELARRAFETHVSFNFDQPHTQPVNYHRMCREHRAGALANHIQFAELCGEEEVIVNLDGDDELAHPDVLTRLAREYADPAVWLTYGSFEHDHESRNPNGDARGICARLPEDLHNRHAGWMTSHLRTYKAWLFKRIKREDLMVDGKFYPVSCDLAMMFPMIEMCGFEHARFIADTLYLYNGVNPLNDHKVFNMEDGNRLRQYLMNRPTYPRISK